MITLLLALLFQVNAQHPPISVPLSRLEQRQIAAIPSYKFADVHKAQNLLIDQHQPANEPKASCSPVTEGYRGHAYRPEDIIYVWEEPKCSAK